MYDANRAKSLAVQAFLSVAKPATPTPENDSKLVELRQLLHLVSGALSKAAHAEHTAQIAKMEVLKVQRDLVVRVELREQELGIFHNYDDDYEEHA